MKKDANKGRESWQDVIEMAQDWERRTCGIWTCEIRRETWSEEKPLTILSIGWEQHMDVNL